MALSLQEYHERWQQDILWWEENEVTNESCIFFETGDSPMAEGCYTFPDFGHAICYHRYWHAPEEADLSPEDTSDLAELAPGLAVIQRIHEHFSPAKISAEEYHARWETTAQALDALLAEFVERGYNPEMNDRLREIVNHAVIPWWLHEIFVLPGDLEAVLNFVGGNPLVNEDDYETEEDYQKALAHAPAFDLANPEHCDALSKRIWEMGR